MSTSKFTMLVSLFHCNKGYIIMLFARKWSVSWKILPRSWAQPEHYDLRSFQHFSFNNFQWYLSSWGIWKERHRGKNCCCWMGKKDEKTLFRYDVVMSLSCDVFHIFWLQSCELSRFRTNTFHGRYAVDICICLIVRPQRPSLRGSV